MNIDNSTKCYRTIRNDIQILRAIAVAFVILYHARLPFIKDGYLGVDIFFVVSGFLITTMIKDSISNKTFSLKSFYIQRARRLLPAAYTTFFFTCILSPFFLTSQELNEFRDQLIGAVTFTANIVLWKQTGYFGGDASLKPLLHTWSLAIEEQYYFVLPLALLTLPARYWKSAIFLALISSLALCILFVSTKPSATFYLLPTRAWELSIGSIAAFYIGNNIVHRFSKVAFWPSLLLILSVPVYSPGHHHPGFGSVIVCLSTAIIIVRNHKCLSHGLWVQRVKPLGDLSYSLYLVHWPIFTFLNNVWVAESPPPLILRIICIIISFFLAFILNRGIEEPLRRSNVSSSLKFLSFASLASVGLVLTATGLTAVSETNRDYSYIRRANYGMSSACEFINGFEPIPECRNSDEPQLMVWGDSFAMHLVPGLLANPAAPPMIQATLSSCAPFLGLAPVRNRSTTWADKCIEFNNSVLAYLREAPSIHTVVLSSPFTAYVDPNSPWKLKKISTPKSNSEIHYPTTTLAFDGLHATVKAIRNLGKKVVIVAPPPSGIFDVGRCLERLWTGAPIIGTRDGCKIPELEYIEKRRPVLDFLTNFEDGADVQVIRFDEYLCSEGFCQTVIGDTLLYRDSGHLSYNGSILLATETHLLEKILVYAR